MKERHMGKMIEDNLEENFRPSCARAEDLVTYLYDEAAEGDDAAEFKLHLKHCLECSQELAAFSQVRGGLLEWRNRSLPFFEPDKTAAHLTEEPITATPRRRSAIAALREFFTLAPAWMRAATALGAFAVCALIVFTAIRFSEPGTIVQTVPQKPSQDEVDALVRQRAEELREKERREMAAPPMPEQKSAAVVKDSGAVRPAKTRRYNPKQSSSVAKREQKRLTPDRTSQEVRQQLAELVQSSREDDGLPRLSDLIEDSNEPQ